MTQEEGLRARCETTIKTLRGLLPEKVDYGRLVCAEGFACGQHYVWTDPEPYAMEEAASCIEALLTENERLRKRAENNQTCYVSEVCEHERLRNELREANDLISWAAAWLNLRGKEGADDLLYTFSKHLAARALMKGGTAG